MTPGPIACCPDAYHCPASGRTLCPRHDKLAGACCDKPDAHEPIAVEAWHLGQEYLEQRLLTAYLRARHLYRGKDPETVRRLLFGQ